MTSIDNFFFDNKRNTRLIPTCCIWLYLHYVRDEWSVQDSLGVPPLLLVLVEGLGVPHPFLIIIMIIHFVFYFSFFWKVLRTPLFVFVGNMYLCFTTWWPDYAHSSDIFNIFPIVQKSKMSKRERVSIDHCIESLNSVHSDEKTRKAGLDQPSLNHYDRPPHRCPTQPSGTLVLGKSANDSLSSHLLPWCSQR